MYRPSTYAAPPEKPLLIALLLAVSRRRLVCEMRCVIERHETVAQHDCRADRPEPIEQWLDWTARSFGQNRACRGYSKQPVSDDGLEFTSIGGRRLISFAQKNPTEICGIGKADGV